MKNVRMGIVGYGNIGSAHAHCILCDTINGLELTAICDIDKNKLRIAQKAAPTVNLFSSYEEMIGSGVVDAVLICTPHYLHPQIAIFAFKKGLHVLTEKPAGVYTQQVEQMNNAARRAGTVYGIMFNQRVNSLYRQARELVKSGKLGQTKRLVWIITNWYRTQAYYDSGDWRATWSGEGGGVLMNQAPHNLDLWQWIFGMPNRLRAVCNVGKYHNIEVEDEATIYAEYENGATATFLTSTGEYPGTNRLEMIGENGKIVIEHGKLHFWELSISERTYCFDKNSNNTKPEIIYQELSPQQHENTAHAFILQNFIDSILKGTELLAPGYDGLNELSIANAAYLSAWTDQWVNLPVDGCSFLEHLKKRIELSNKKAKITNCNSPSGEYNARWNINW